MLKPTIRKLKMLVIFVEILRKICLIVVAFVCIVGKVFFYLGCVNI